MSKQPIDLNKYGNVPLEYNMLALDLSQYRSPKDKIDSLVQERKLIRLKKGWYVVSKDVTGESYCPGSIANNMYGPSYVSLESALSYYGIIPEGVPTTFSVTSKKTQGYTNEIGRFEYNKVAKEYYPIGLSLLSTGKNCSFLIAEPEKALCDILYFLRGYRIQSKKAMREYLFSDMRMDFTFHHSFNEDIFNQVIETGIKTRTFELLKEVLHDEFGR